MTDLRKRLDPLIILAIVLGLVAGLSVVTLLVLVPIVLFSKHKGRGQKITSIKEMFEILERSNLPEEEVKKQMSNLNKAHLKLMFPKIRVEFDADEDLDEEPVIMFTQFLRDSFVEGLKSDDKLIKDEFIAAFNKIKGKVPQTGDNETARYSAGDEVIANRTSRPEPHRSPQEFPSGVIEMQTHEGDNSIDAATHV